MVQIFILEIYLKSLSLSLSLSYMKKSEKYFAVLLISVAILSVALISAFSLTGNVINSYVEPVKVFNVTSYSAGPDGMSNTGDDSFCLETKIPKTFVMDAFGNYRNNVFRTESGIFVIGRSNPSGGADYDTDTVLESPEDFIRYYDIADGEIKLKGRNYVYNFCVSFSDFSSEFQSLVLNFGLTILNQNNRILGHGEFKIFYDTNSKFFGAHNIEWGEFTYMSPPVAPPEEPEVVENNLLNNILEK